MLRQPRFPYDEGDQFNYEALQIHLTQNFQFADRNIVEYTLKGYPNANIVAYGWTFEDYIDQLWSFYEGHRGVARMSRIYWRVTNGMMGSSYIDYGTYTKDEFYSDIIAKLQSNDQLSITDIDFIMIFWNQNIMRGRIKPLIKYKGITLIDGGDKGECFFIALLHHILKDPESCNQLLGRRDFRNSKRTKVSMKVQDIQTRIHNPLYPEYRKALDLLKDSLADCGDPVAHTEYLQKVVSKYPRIQILIFFWNNLKVIHDARGTLFQPLNNECVGLNFPMTMNNRRQNTEYDKEPKELTLKLYFTDSHVNIITNIRAFLPDSQNLCLFCTKIFPAQNYARISSESVDGHVCLGIEKCVVCLRPKDRCREYAEEQDEILTCGICGVTSFDRSCMLSHTQNPACVDHRVDCECGVPYPYSQRAKHVCGMKYCETCKNKQPLDHLCYFHKLGLKDKKVPNRYFSFDFECMFDNSELVTVNLLENGHLVQRQIPLQKHIINYIVCQEMGEEEVFTFTTFASFLEWMETFDQEREYHFFAHNMGKYDGRLFFSEYLKIRSKIPSAVWSGLKILQMIIPSPHEGVFLKIRDSLPHITQPLDSFPKTFGLNVNDFKKGFFPYTFNVAENQNYIGSIPSIEYFNPRGMKQTRYDEFNEWYPLQTGVYDFQKELQEYCISDVKLLNAGLEVYQRNALTNTRLDPLINLTIASFAMDDFLTNHYDPKKLPVYPIPEHIETMIKPSFHGGRTDARCMLFELTDEEKEMGWKIFHIDANSLYPATQIFDPVPYGKPRVDHEPHLDQLPTFFGFAKIDYEVTQFHFHPIPTLLSDEDQKLWADLKDRKGVVMTSPEIQKMLESSFYLITRVYWIIHYTQTTELFASYLNNCYGGKTLNDRNAADHDIQDAIDLYEHTNHKIDIRGQTFEKNPGMKAIFKLLCNSLWGKFGQRSEYDSTAIMNIGQFMDACRKMEQGTLDIFQIFHHPSNQDQVMTTMRGEEKDFMASVKKNDEKMRNVAIASFVTANGRLRLWDKMNQLGGRVLYHDTDSIVYVSKSPEDRIPEGQMLGEWVSELNHDEYIDRFVSTGPKSYSYRVVKADGSTKMKCKVKGHCLNVQNQNLISYDQLKDVVLHPELKFYSNDFMFKYNRQQGTMMTRPQAKVFQHTYSKGLILPEKRYVVMPFGYDRFLDPEGAWNPLDLK